MSLINYCRPRLSPCCLHYVTKRSIADRLTSVERKRVYETLNVATKSNLLNWRVSPGLASRILQERDLHGRLDTDTWNETGIPSSKFEILGNIILEKEMSIDDLQNILKNQYSKDAGIMDNYMGGKPAKLKGKKFIPVLSDDAVNNLSTILALDFSMLHFSWALINRSGCILSLGCDDAFSSGQLLKTSDLHFIYRQVLYATSRLPSADLIVLEEPSRPQPSMKKFRNQFQFIHGILISLLDDSDFPNVPHPLFYMSSNLIPRIFNLNVGSEKASSLELGGALLSGQCPLTSFSNYTYSMEAIQQFILAEGIEKEFMSNAMLSALGFHFCIYNKALPGTVSKREEVRQKVSESGKS